MYKQRIKKKRYVGTIFSREVGHFQLSVLKINYIVVKVFYKIKTNRYIQNHSTA